MITNQVFYKNYKSQALDNSLSDTTNILPLAKEPLEIPANCAPGEMRRLKIF